MKFALLLTVLSFNLYALTKSKVCSGEKLHYTYSQSYLDRELPRGTATGQEFLASRGKVLGQRFFRSKTPAKGFWDLDLKLSQMKTLAGEGDLISGWSVYSAVLSVSQSGKKLSKEAVTCKETWSRMF